MKKLFSILFALVLVLSLSLVTAVPAAAQEVGEVWVDDGWAETTLGADPDGEGPAASFGTDAFATIQAGIDAVDPDGTVNVAAGTYHEGLASWKAIEITKSLSLIGAGSGATIVELTEGQLNGVEIYQTTYDSGNPLDVTLQGITFTRTPGNTYATKYNPIRVAEHPSTFSKLTFKDVEVAYAEAENVFLGGDGTFDEVYIEDCYFHHAGAQAFLSRGTYNKMTVINSDFEYNGQVDPAQGNGFDVCGRRTIDVASLTVTGGTFNNNTSKGINLTNITNASFTDITASNNSGAPRGGKGVVVWEWIGASQNLVFNNPTLTNNSFYGFVIGAEGAKTVSGVTINGGTLTDNGRGGLFISDFDENNPSDTGVIENVKVTGAEIFGNTEYGVCNETETTFDATNNWWGSASGPADAAAYEASGYEAYGDAVSTNVDYEPWLLVEDGAPYNKTLALKKGWTLVSTNKAVADTTSGWVGLAGTEANSVLKYAVEGGTLVWGSATTTDLKPVDVLCIKTVDGGGVGIKYADSQAGVSSKRLLAGWNLISSGTTPVVEGTPSPSAYDVLSPLPFAKIGGEQPVGLTTLVSQGSYNQFSGSFYQATLDTLDWTALKGIALNPYDGYWIHMNAACDFGVITD